MPLPYAKNLPPSLSIRGKLTLQDPVLKTTHTVVIQATSPQFATHLDAQGNPIQVRAYVPTPNPNTPEQQIVRSRFRDAVAAWHDLSSPEREAFQPLATQKRLPLYHAFISWYMSQ